VRPRICATCGVESDREVAICPICADERQWVPPSGQRWTTLAELAGQPHELAIRELEPGLFGLHREPGYAIGQWSILVQTPRGNLIWDPPNFVDAGAIDRIRQLGGVAAIAASHPHMFGTQVSWSHAFDNAPVWVNAADMEWVQRPDPVIRTWSNEADLFPGVTLVQCGGHFPGSSVAHWSLGSEGRGSLLTGDTIMAGQATGWVSWMRSYPNRIPLSAAVVERIVRRLEPYHYDRLYSLNGASLDGDARTAVRRSADRYVAWVRGDRDSET
jgi:glyoxylase-like metal-dependent hydrolase (beta-lactamase superfamily II)